MHKRTIFLTSSTSAAIAAALALLWLLGGMRISGPQAAHAAGPHHVAPCGNCGAASPCYATVQAAADAADSGDIIKVAQGIYTDVHARDGVTQVVYISKTVTILGGYTTADWATPDPENNPTTLDAQGQGRVFYATGNITHRRGIARHRRRRGRTGRLLLGN
jgi:hypothetical protein